MCFICEITALAEKQAKEEDRDMEFIAQLLTELPGVREETTGNKAAQSAVRADLGNTMMVQTPYVEPKRNQDLINRFREREGQVSQTTPSTAPEFLAQAKKHMQDRASTYDKPEGERSMANTVAAFNTITGKDLSEQDGWLFMALLKMVRANQGNFKSDNYEDLVAYAALLGEAAVKAQ